MLNLNPALFCLAAQGETTFWQDLINYFNDAMRFENIGNLSGGLLSLPLLIIGLFVGAAIAVIATVFNKKVLGDFVRALLREGCLSPETARDLDYLNYIHSGTIRQAVRGGASLRRVVKCKEEEEHKKKMEELAAEYEAKKAAGEDVEKFIPTEYRPDPYMDHFYIPEEMKYMADIKFEKKGSTAINAVIALVLLLGGLILVILFLPQVMKFLDNFIGLL